MLRILVCAIALCAAAVLHPLCTWDVEALAPQSTFQPFNPGHGHRMLQRLQRERRKLLQALQRQGKNLTIRFANMAHTPPVNPEDIPGFDQASLISFELPPSAVTAFLKGQETVLRKNTFWTKLLESGMAMSKQEGMVGVDSFAPARNVARRMVYAYTGVDHFHHAKPRTLRQMGQTSLPEGERLLKVIAVSEAECLPRLTESQREELAKNRMLELRAGDPNPLESGNTPLQNGLVLFREPHPSFIFLLEGLRERYGKDLMARGVPEENLTYFLVTEFMHPVLVLARDYMQVGMMFRRWQVFLKSKERTLPQDILALHIGGAAHYPDLATLAAWDIPHDSPLRFEKTDDSRFPAFTHAHMTGASPFFAHKFEEIMDHVSIAPDGEMELDAPYFVSLFGRYLRQENRLLTEKILTLAIVPIAFAHMPSDLEEGNDSALSGLRDAFTLSGLLNVLKEEDFERLRACFDAKTRDASRALDQLRLLFGNMEYQEFAWVVPMLEKAKVRAEAQSAIERKDLKAMVEYLERILDATPQDVVAWINLGVVRHERKDDKEAVVAYRRALALDKMNVLAWYYLGVSLHCLEDYSGAIAAYGQAMGYNSEKGLAENIRMNLCITWVRLGAEKYAQGDFLGAQDAYVNGLDFWKEFAGGWQRLGKALEALGDLSGAEEAYRKAIRQDSSNLDYHQDLGRVRAVAGDPTQIALELLEVLTENPGNVAKRAEFDGVQHALLQRMKQKRLLERSS